jgi:hypothetical protein
MLLTTKHSAKQSDKARRGWGSNEAAKTVAEALAATAIANSLNTNSLNTNSLNTNSLNKYRPNMQHLLPQSKTLELSTSDSGCL